MRVRPPATHVDAATGLLWTHAPAAVHEHDGPGGIELEAAYDDSHAAAATAAALVSAGWPVEVSEVDDEPWLDTWRAHAGIVEIDERLVVVPAWLEPPVGTTALVVSIDPGRAFGHGAHPTTKLALRGILDHVQPACRVLDVGSGSGVLAVVAARLGAGRVVAVDTDPAAVQATVDNARRNGVADLVDARLGSIDAAPRDFDVVVANIGAGTLLALAPSLVASVVPGGRILLGGFLVDRTDEVAAGYEAAGGSVDEVADDDGWGALVVRRR